jgi:hypothetical protein
MYGDHLLRLHENEIKKYDPENVTAWASQADGSSKWLIRGLSV